MKQSDIILRAMLTDKTKRWWYPVDFMQLGASNFVGYEASARLSEIAKKYPDMLASERDGKYMKRRILWENVDTWISQLPATIKVKR